MDHAAQTKNYPKVLVEVVAKWIWRMVQDSHDVFTTDTLGLKWMSGKHVFGFPAKKPPVCVFLQGVWKKDRHIPPRSIIYRYIIYLYIRFSAPKVIVCLRWTALTLVGFSSWHTHGPSIIPFTKPLLQLNLPPVLVFGFIWIGGTGPGPANFPGDWTVVCWLGLYN